MQKLSVDRLSIDHPEFGPDLLSDPAFIPCRDEACPRPGVHAAHEVIMPCRSHRSLDQCPECQTPLVVMQAKRRTIGRKKTRHVITAHCPACGWTFTNSTRKSHEADLAR